MKKVIFYDEGKFNVDMTKINEAKERFSELLAEVSTMELFKAKSIHDLIELVNDGPREKIGRELEVSTVGGFQMKREALVQTLELPDLTRVDELRELAKPYAYHASKFLTLKKDKITINEDEVTRLREECTISAENDAQAEFFRLHQQTAENLTKLNQMILQMNAGIILPESKYAGPLGLFSFDGGKISPSMYFYQSKRGRFKSLE